MKAVVYNKKARPEKLEYCDISKPLPSDEEVLIRVHAVSLNAADYRSLKLGIIPKKKIFGADISGVIESAGRYISRFRTGDEVMGDLASAGFGGLAEYAVTPERLLVKKPAKVSFEDCAALPMAGVTALQALRDKGKIQKGMKVLILGSAGGVGTFAVQLAKYFGAEVTGVCSTRNLQQTLSFGADRVMDYTVEDIWKKPDRYDIILGINGRHSLYAYRKALASGGTCVMVGGALTQIFGSLLFGWLFSIGSKKIITLAAKANYADLEFLASLLEQGVIKPVIDRHYPFQHAVEAFRYLSQGHATGKVVINIHNS